MEQKVLNNIKVGDLVTCTHYLDGVYGQVKEIDKDNRVTIDLVQPITKIVGNIDDFKPINNMNKIC